MMNRFIEWFGWYGMAAILSAYTANNLEWLETTDITYLILNLSGAFGIMVTSFQKRAYQPAVLNVVWAAVALFGVIRYYLN